VFIPDLKNERAKDPPFTARGGGLLDEGAKLRSKADRPAADAFRSCRREIASDIGRTSFGPRFLLRVRGSSCVAWHIAPAAAPVSFLLIVAVTPKKHRRLSASHLIPPIRLRRVAGRRGLP
jgi:hypothetical protein